MLLKYFVVTLLILHGSHAEEESGSNRQPSLEETVQEKFGILQKTIIDTLEEHINKKIDSLQNQLNKKIELIQENVSELRNNSDSGENTLQSGEISQINENLNKIKNDLSLLPATIGKVASLEGNLNRTWEEVERLVPLIEYGIKSDLSELNRKVPDTNVKLNALEVQIQNFDKKLRNEFEYLENLVSQKLETLKNAISEKNLNNTCSESNWAENDYRYCKTRNAEGFDFVPIAFAGLNHTNVEYDSNGEIAKLEMYFAIKGNHTSLIQLSKTDHPTAQDKYIVISFKKNYETHIRGASPSYDGNVNKLYLDSIRKVTNGVNLSKDKFNAFYLKIDNGLLEITPLGVKSPNIISYSDKNLKMYKYIGFTVVEHNYFKYKSHYLYDCPAGFQDTLPQEETKK